MMAERGEWPLENTVKSYRRHFLVCTGANEWPARLEDADGLLGQMARDAYALREAPRHAPKLTATDEPTSGTGLDLLVFPDAIRYQSVGPESWPAIVHDHLERGRQCEDVGATPLIGRHVFVCTHAARDDRCGTCGPPLIEALKEALASRGVEDVTVRATSHVGGHKYAGNVLIYPEGVWYGYVAIADVPRIVDEHLGSGRVVHELTRGRMESV